MAPVNSELIRSQQKQYREEKNFIRTSSEVAVSAEGKGRSCFPSCRNKHSIYNELPSRKCLVWFVLAISLRINNSMYFYTVSYRVRRLLVQRSCPLPAGNCPQCPRLTANGDSISAGRAWYLQLFLLH